MSDFDLHSWDNEPDDEVEPTAAGAGDEDGDEDVEAHGSWGSAG